MFVFPVCVSLVKLSQVTLLFIAGLLILTWVEAG